MNKNDFLQTLELHLKGIPTEDIQEIIADYNEHFEVGLTKGRSEEEIAFSLGNPRTIAKELKANILVNQASESFSVNNFFQALIATLGLGFFNLVFVLGPFLGIFGAIIGFLGGSIIVVVSGFAVIVIGFMDMSILLLALFSGVAVICFGLILTILVLIGCKYFFKFTIRYLQWNINIITRRRVSNESI